MIKFFQKNKKLKNILTFLFLSFVFLVFGNYCYALDWNIENVTISIIGWVANIFVVICGFILKLIIQGIIAIGEYNNFIHEESIIEAWKIIRDFCNMFFILILLVIAFATILRRESYNMKKWLPKLILMAILINFSRMICGVLIDASQIVFLTFVSTFSSNGADFVAAIRVKDFLSLSVESVTGKGSGEVNPDFISTVAAMIIGVIFLIISIIVLLAILISLVVRAVMFWIYVVLSPLAFLMASFPEGQKYSSQYWGEFTKYLISGPALAFFVWLSLVTSNGASGIEAVEFSGVKNISNGVNDASSILNINIFLPFLMSIGMLVGGLMVSAQMGNVGASWGQGMVGKLKGKAVGLAKAGAFGAGIWAGKKAWGGAKELGYHAKSLDAMAGGKLAGLTQAIKNKEGAVGGALSGAMVGAAGGPLGLLAGALLGGAGGGYYGKKFADSWGNIRKLNNERVNSAKAGAKDASFEEDGKKLKWSDDYGHYYDENIGDEKIAHRDANGKIVSRWKEIKGKDGAEYRRKNADDDKFYKIDSAGNFVKKDGSAFSDIDDVTDSKNLYASQNAFRLGDTRAIGNANMTRLVSYMSSTNKGQIAKESAENEAIETLSKDYTNMSNEMLRQLLEMEKDEGKKAAIAMTLAIKNGFKDASEVARAKEALGGNGLLLGKFNDNMNKKNMAMNNMRSDGKLDEATIAKLVSTGKADWKDQDVKGMTPDAYLLMAKQQGANFNKTLESMARTDKDKSEIAKKLKQAKDLDANNFHGSTSVEKGENKFNMKNAYAKMSGNYVEAFNGGVNEMMKSIKNISKTGDFGNINKSDLDNPFFKTAFSTSVDINTLKKISKSNEISNEMIKKYMEIVRDNNSQLKAKMSNDPELQHYV